MTINKLAIIQARMASSRLPGKVMCEVSGRPLLQYMLERVRRAKLIDSVVLATTNDTSDDILEAFCREHDLPCYRGSLYDVLDRFYHAAVQFHADVIIRLTADCPLIDPELIDQTVAVFLDQILPYTPDLPPLTPDNQAPSAFNPDFAANRLPPPWKRTIPIGLDVEVCTFNSLKRAWKEAHEQHQREHVMPYIYEEVSFQEQHPLPEVGWYIERGVTTHGFKLALLNHEPDYGALRWTVDTAEDLEFIRQIADRFNSRIEFGWLDVLSLLEKEPDLASINQDTKHRSAFDTDQRAKDL